ncbi:hypothetical protein [Enterococcus sp.]|uniref:hypothetical protein n=1 Tax=Enterococcus sp. TaxID=35783 RepID=UPI002898EB34|nr:hypothetical protein [Enterococcus sp.]
MRLRKKDLQTLYLKQRNVTTEADGNVLVDYSLEFEELEMNVQPAGGKILAQKYGNELDLMKSCLYQGDKINEGRNEKDGICLFSAPDEEPDYEIISIQTFSTHKNITIKKLAKGGKNNG